MNLRSDRPIRTLLAADVPAALELSDAAGWNQTAEDWHRLITLAPEGCLAIEADARIVATATLLCYGQELAWVGMVLTHHDYQRRGLARRLVEATLQLADTRGVRTVKLDATDQGRPLYAALGFRDEQPIERWRREATAAAGSEPDVRVDAALDLEAFGADRSRFLESLNWRMQRPGSRASYLGPCVFSSAAEAQSAIGAIVAGSPGPWFWDLLPSNTDAVRIARQLNFAPLRRLVRMVRGATIQTNDALVYAIGGFEAG